mgnify:CR=1 FL=1
MEQDGETNEDIRRQTGWFRGADGKWRMEVDDSDAVYYRNGNARQDGAEAGQWQGKSGTLRDYLYHPTLERLEPQVFEVPMQVVDTLPPNTNARYRGRQGGIEASKSAQRGSICTKHSMAYRKSRDLRGGATMRRPTDGALSKTMRE